MERILSNEYFSFEQGYFDGINDAVLQFSSDDEEIEFGEIYDDGLDKMPYNKKWYDMGYEDGKKYYSGLLWEYGMPGILVFGDEHMLEEFYTRRVLDYNTLENKEMPIGVFKIR